MRAKASKRCAKSSATVTERRIDINRKERESRHDRDRAPNEWEQDWLDDTDGWETSEAPRTKKGDRRASGDDIVEEGVGEAIVLTSRGKASVVMFGSETVRAYRPMNVHLVVGDKVSLSRRPDGSIWISGVAERRTHLSRPDPHNPREQRIMAANIDVAVHVSSPMNPPLRPALIDRFLVAILNGGTRPVIAINKMDLLTPAQRKFIDEEVDDYRQLDVPLVYCSAKTGEGIEDLRALLKGRLSAVAGHSGVGKSSLLNALHPVVSARVGDVQERSGRGRHTTSFAAMFDLGDGTRIIDTPGVREFGLWDIDRTQLRFYFREFEPFALECRFSNCTHLHEPACAVKDAVEREEISERRYEAYENLVSQMK